VLCDGTHVAHVESVEEPSAVQAAVVAAKQSTQRQLLSLFCCCLQEGTIEAILQAALDADMPPSCKRTLYLCDQD
jgi:hypothetical protein